jgi:flagellin-like protein
MTRVLRRKSKAITPVLATVILIAVTLVSALAAAGYMFGLLGTFANSAVVSAGAASCSGTPEVCTLFLHNIGSASTTITGTCSLKFGGASYQGSSAVVSGNLNSGNVASITCTAPGGAHANSGSQITGSITLSNGAQVLYSGSAQ